MTYIHIVSYLSSLTNLIQGRLTIPIIYRKITVLDGKDVNVKFHRDFERQFTVQNKNHTIAVYSIQTGHASAKHRNSNAPLWLVLTSSVSKIWHLFDSSGRIYTSIIEILALQDSLNSNFHHVVKFLNFEAKFWQLQLKFEQEFWDENSKNWP